MVHSVVAFLLEMEIEANTN